MAELMTLAEVAGARWGISRLFCLEHMAITLIRVDGVHSDNFFKLLSTITFTFHKNR